MQHEKIELNKLYAQSKVTLIRQRQGQRKVIFIFAAHTHMQTGREEERQRQRKSEKATPAWPKHKNKLISQRIWICNMRCRWLSYAPHSPPHLILPSPCSSSRISVLLFCYELFWLVCMWNFWSNNKNNYPWVQIERGTERERERELAEQRWRRRRRRMNMMHEITIMKWQQKARITKGLPACQADWTTARSAKEVGGEARHAHVRRAVDRCRRGAGKGRGHENQMWFLVTLKIVD